MTRVMARRSIAMRASRQRTMAVRAQYPVSGGGALIGIENLATSAIVYGQTIAPKLYYRGQEYAGASWAGLAGPTLAQAGSGTSPTIVDAPSEAVHAADAGVLCNYGAGKYFSSSPDVASGDVTTEDMILELWLKPGPNALDFAFTKRGSTSQGWMAYSASTAFKVSLKWNTTSVVCSWTITAATWVHLVVGVDRSSATGIYCIKNGVLQGTTYDPTALTTLTSTTPTFIGAVNGGGPSCASSIALAALWAANGWLDADDKPALAAWALARYNQSMGL